jgi:hypothetical protein
MEGMRMNENALSEKISRFSGTITSRFTGNGPLSSDIEVIYDELDRTDSDVRDALTSVRGSGLKDLFIQAVFFNSRCCLKSIIKDEPNYLIGGYLESVLGIYRKSRENDKAGDAQVSNKELAEKVAALLDHGISGEE